MEIKEPVSELHKRRRVKEMENFKGDDGKPPVTAYTLGILLRDNQIGNGGKWTIAEWIDCVLSGRLAFPERFYSDDVRRATIEAARRFPPLTGPDKEINDYLLERLSYYDALEEVSRSGPIKTAGQIKVAVLVEPRYFTPKKISQITGLASSRIEEIACNNGASATENGKGRHGAHNVPDIIQSLLKSRDEPGAVRLYNAYVQMLLEHRI